MQTKTLFIFCFLMFSCAIAFGQAYQSVASLSGTRTEPSFQVTVLPDKSAAAFDLYIYNPEKKKINFQISNKESGMLVDTVIADGQFKRRYNFSEAADGQYFIVLKNGKEKINKTAKVNTVVVRSVLVE